MPSFLSDRDKLSDPQKEHIAKAIAEAMEPIVKSFAEMVEHVKKSLPPQSAPETAPGADEDKTGASDPTG